jgi:hypothetical protein
MTQGRKPDVTITFKPKDGGKDDRKQIMAGWEGQYGINMKLGRDVVAIKLSDGTVINAESGYYDMRDWRQSEHHGGGGQARRDPEPHGDDGWAADDPF